MPKIVKKKNNINFLTHLVGYIFIILILFGRGWLGGLVKEKL